MTKLAISATRDGWRRAGRAWTVEPQTVDEADFSAEQLEMLRGDPAVAVVTVFDGEEMSEDPLRRFLPLLEAAGLTPESTDGDILAAAGMQALAPPEDPPDDGVANRTERLLTAIATMAEGDRDEADWTKDGRPEVRALARNAGVDDLTAAERDAVWDAWTAR